MMLFLMSQSLQPNNSIAKVDYNLSQNISLKRVERIIHIKKFIKARTMLLQQNMELMAQYIKKIIVKEKRVMKIMTKIYMKNKKLIKIIKELDKFLNKE